MYFNEFVSFIHFYYTIIKNIFSDNAQKNKVPSWIIDELKKNISKNRNEHELNTNEQNYCDFNNENISQILPHVWIFDTYIIFILFHGLITTDLFFKLTFVIFFFQLINKNNDRENQLINENFENDDFDNQNDAELTKSKFEKKDPSISRKHVVV